MDDQISIRDIRFRAPCGVLPEERTLTVAFSADVTLSLDLAPAAATDQLDWSVDYGAVIAMVVAVATGRERLLIERMVDEVVQAILEAFPLVNTVRVAMSKPQLPLDHAAGGITITMTRRRD